MLCVSTSFLASGLALDGRRVIADARQALLDDFRLKRLPSADVYLRLGAIEEGRLF